MSAKPVTKDETATPGYVYLMAVGLGLCFTFRDANRYTVIDFPNHSSLEDLLFLSFARLLPLILLAVAYRYRLKMNPQRDLGDSYHFNGFFIPHMPRVVAITLVAMTGMIVIFISSFGITYSSETITAGKILLGIGNTLFIVVYGELLLPQGRHVTVQTFILASYTYGLLRMVFGILAPGVSLVLLILCPALSCLCLYESLVSRKEPELPPRRSASNNAALDKLTAAPGFYIFLFAGIACYTFVFSELYNSWEGVHSSEPITTIGLQVATGLGVILGTFVVSKARDYLTMEYLTSYSMLAPTLIVSVLYLSTILTDHWLIFYVIPLYGAQRIVFFLIWNLAIFQKRPLAKLQTFCISMGCLELGVCGYYGMKAFNLLVPDFADEISLVVIIIMIGFIISKEVGTWFLMEKVRTANHEEHEAELAAKSDVEMVPADILRACDGVAEQYRLTKRERELLPFLILGRPSDYIAEVLVISPSTVKTHIRNIYRKVEVGKRTDLLLLIEHWDEQEH